MGKLLDKTVMVAEGGRGFVWKMWTKLSQQSAANKAFLCVCTKINSSFLDRATIRSVTGNQIRAVYIFK